MYKVMLVDDEPIIIRGMKQLIDWEKEGYVICDSAYSAQEALEKLDNINPDIIITDLVMPEVDGIEFIKTLKSTKPNIETIILSGYGEFEYARQALSSGVCEYLVKPVTRSQLIDTLSKASKTISMRTNHQKEYIELKERLQVSMPLLKNKYILDIIKGQIKNDEEISRRSDLVDFKFKGKSFIAIMDARGKLDIEHEVNSDVYFNLAVKSACEEYLNKYGKGYVLFDGEYICLFGTNMQQELLEVTAYEIVNGIWHDMQSRYNVDVTIGLGPCFDDLRQSPNVYQEAWNALKSSFFLGEGQIIHYKNAALGSHDVMEYPDDVADMIIEKIRYDNSSNSMILAKELIESFVKNAGHDIDVIYQYCYQFCIQLSRIHKSLDNAQKSVSYNIPLDLENIRKCKTTNELQKYLKKMIDNDISILNKLRSEKLNSVIGKVKDYIKNNLAGDLSLNAIASIVFMNPVYLSTLFKNKTGFMYHDYIFRTRMKHAQKLLLDSQLKIYEVAQQVGYSNARSFSDAFKRFCGLTPSIYINNHVNKKNSEAI